MRVMGREGRRQEGEDDGKERKQWTDGCGGYLLHTEAHQW